MRVFISYGHDEYLEFAEQIKADLQAHGHEVWFDRDRLKPGVDYEHYIEEGLEWCAALPDQGRVVLLMTPHSVRRPDGFCLNEIAAAINLGIPIIPIMVVWCRPPLSVCRIQWLDMQDCVPVARRHEKYQIKFLLLIGALEHNRTDFEGSQSLLLHLLKPLDFSADIARYVPQFVGREWLFRQIDDWVSDRAPSSRVFWIVGGPGTGKTAVAAFLCHRRGEVAAFHFCRYMHEDKSDPRRCIMSLAYQLGSQLPEYSDRLLVMDLREEILKSASTLFDDLIVEPLTSLPAPSRPILVVIDALDEATHSGTNELTHLIAKEFPRTPQWVRLLITSRPAPEVMQPLQGLVPYFLDPQCRENLEDIKVYIKHTLPAALLNRDLTIQSLAGRSEGNFLYVEMALAALQEGKMTLEQIDALPKGLGGCFMQFFSRQFPDINIYTKRMRPVLEMVIAARGPLPLKTAQDALQWDEYTCRDVVAALSSLFLRERGNIRPFHHSLADWLTNAEWAGPYYISARAGRERLADWCWREYQSGVSTMSGYCVTNSHVHLAEAGRWDSLVDLVFSPELGLIPQWVDEGGSGNTLEYLMKLIDYLGKQRGKRVISAGLATQIARIYSQRGQYDEAQSWLDRALNYTAWWQGRRVRAIAFHEEASLYLYRHEFRQTKRLYRRALRLCLYGVPQYHDEAAANLVGLASTLHVEYNFTKSIQFARRALHYAEIAKDIGHILAARRLIGLSCKSIGEYELAEFQVQTALILADEHGAYLEKARLLLLKGWLLYDRATFKQEQPEAARLCFEQTLSLASKIYDSYCITEAKLSLGWCALMVGAPEIAANWIEPLADAFPSHIHPELRAGAELGVAAIVHTMGNLERAQELYKHVVQFCNEYDLRWWKCKGLIGLGATYHHLDMYKDAERRWEEALYVAGQLSKSRTRLAEIMIERCRKSPLSPPG